MIVAVWQNQLKAELKCILLCSWCNLQDQRIFYLSLFVAHKITDHHPQSRFFFFVTLQKSITAPIFILLQHFREHLDKLFAQGIGMLDVALTEAFNLLRDVSNNLTFADRIHLIWVA